MGLQTPLNRSLRTGTERGRHSRRSVAHLDSCDRSRRDLQGWGGYCCCRHLWQHRGNQHWLRLCSLKRWRLQRGTSVGLVGVSGQVGYGDGRGTPSAAQEETVCLLLPRSCCVARAVQHQEALGLDRSRGAQGGSFGGRCLGCGGGNDRSGCRGAAEKKEGGEGGWRMGLREGQSAGSSRLALHGRDPDGDGDCLGQRSWWWQQRRRQAVPGMAIGYGRQSTVRVTVITASVIRDVNSGRNMNRLTPT